MTPPPIGAPRTGEEAAGTPPALVLLAWIVVLTPLAWGVLQTLKKASALFQ